MTPYDLILKIETLQNMLLARATGGTADDAEYRALREELLSDAAAAPLLPRFVITCRDLSQFWSFIKPKFAHWDERRNFIWNEFAPALAKLEGIAHPGQDEVETISSKDATDLETPQATDVKRETRRANAHQQVGSSRPIRILFLAANPTDTPSLRLDAEMRAIEQALRQSEYRDRFDIRQHWAVRIVDIQGYLLRHQPDIVHFSGHGSKANAIVLEDDAGNSHHVSPRALSKLFAVLKDNIRCVVLNACYSEQQAIAIAEHIDCVVGMSRAIGDAPAIAFAGAFYQALGFGRDVKTAFDLGCVQIDLENLEEQDTPKLIAHGVDAKDMVFVDSI